MFDLTPGPDLRVECWLRAGDGPVVREVRRELRDRLDRLDRRAAVGSYEVETWGRSVALEEAASVTETGGSAAPATVRERLAAFREWADREDRSLAPAVRRREHTTLDSPATVPVVDLPVACLAVADDDGLAGVYPHAADGEVRRVSDCLDALESTTAPGPD
jgi:hypothetical protein